MNITMQLESLTCPSCMQKIQGALEKQTGVEKVKVLFNASKVKAELAPDADPETIKQVVENLGYAVEDMKVKG